MTGNSAPVNTQSLPTCESLGRWWAGPGHCLCLPASRPRCRQPGDLGAPCGLHHGAWQYFSVATLAIPLLPGLCHRFRLQIRLTRNVFAGYGQIWACTLEIREDTLIRTSRCSLGGRKGTTWLSILGRASSSYWVVERPRGAARSPLGFTSGGLGSCLGLGAA